MREVTYLHNSKLIKLLRTSDKKEQKRFEEYITASFFNKNKEVIVLWKYIKKRLPGFEKIPTEKELLDALYIDKSKKPQKWSPKEDTLLRGSMNRLINLFHDFLIYQRGQTKKVQNRRLLIEELMKRKLYKMVPSVLKTAYKIHDKNPYRDPEYYFDEYLIYEAEFFTNIINHNRSIYNSPNKLIDSFNNYALSNMMIYSASYINNIHILDIPDDLPAMDKLIEYIENNKDRVSRIVIVYYHIYMMISGKKSEEQYWALKEILEDFHTYLPISASLRFIYGSMIGFCAKKIKGGEEKFRLEQYENYKYSLPLGVWDTGIAFSPHRYIQHLRNMLHIGKYKEAEAFQENYKSKLQPKYIPDIVNLGYAFYHYHIGNYDTAQSYLSSVRDREDFAYMIYHKLLLIKIYYEKKEWTALDSNLEALRFYLLPKRSKIMSEQLRNHYKNFLNVCKKILRQRNHVEYNQASINILKKIKQEIKDKESIAERTWLLEKTEEKSQFDTFLFKRIQITNPTFAIIKRYSISYFCHEIHIQKELMQI